MEGDVCYLPGRLLLYPFLDAVLVLLLEPRTDFMLLLNALDVSFGESRIHFRFFVFCVQIFLYVCLHLHICVYVFLVHACTCDVHVCLCLRVYVLYVYVCICIFIYITWCKNCASGHSSAPAIVKVACWNSDEAMQKFLQYFRIWFIPYKPR